MNSPFILDLMNSPLTPDLMNSRLIPDLMNSPFIPDLMNYSHWNAHVLNKLPPSTNYITLSHLELAYQYILCHSHLLVLVDPTGNCHVAPSLLCVHKHSPSFELKKPMSIKMSSFSLCPFMSLFHQQAPLF